MHILYIAIWGQCSQELGIVKKVINQLKHLEKQGIKVDALFFYQTIKWETFDEIQNIKFVKYKEYTNFNTTQQKIFSKIHQHCNKKNYNIIYFRYPIASQYLLDFVKKNPNKVILEHQTKEINELFVLFRKGIIQVQQLLSEIVFAPLVLKYTLGSVGVTDEITEYEKKRAFLNRKLMTATVSNGINVSGIPIKQRKEPTVPIIKLIFVGEYGPWHGLERLVDGIARYNGNFQFKVYVVGSIDLLKDIRNRVKKLNLRSAFYFLGRKMGQDLDRIFNNCDIAIGSLGLHRNKLLEASTLKTREYTSRGIPFVIGYMDTDLKDSKDMSQFYLKVAATEAPIDMDEVVRFFEKVQQIPNYSEQMRDFANKNLDMEVKMKQLATFIRKAHKRSKVQKR